MAIPLTFGLNPNKRLTPAFLKLTNQLSELEDTPIVAPQLTFTKYSSPDLNFNKILLYLFGYLLIIFTEVPAERAIWPP